MKKDNIWVVIMLVACFLAGYSIVMLALSEESDESDESDECDESEEKENLLFQRVKGKEAEAN